MIASPTLCVTPPVTSEIGEAQSYLAVNRDIVRDTVAVNDLGLCGIMLPIGRNSLCPQGRKSGFLRLRSAQERGLGCAADRLGAPVYASGHPA
jgi:aspartyl-tRNA(Asn)/glutamyl-tRNA(Gln) amidotransferase subunit A